MPAARADQAQALAEIARRRHALKQAIRDNFTQTENELKTQRTFHKNKVGELSKSIKNLRRKKGRMLKAAGRLNTDTTDIIALESSLAAPPQDDD